MLRWLILVINREKGRSMGLLLYKKTIFILQKKAFFSLHFEQNMEEEKKREVWYTSPTFFFLPFLLLSHRLLCSLILG